MTGDRPERDLRKIWETSEVWKRPEPECWRLTALTKFERDGRTEKVTPWAPVGAKNKFGFEELVQAGVDTGMSII